LIADRFPRQKLLIITQVMMMTLAIILAALTFTGLVQPWHILVMAFFLGIANAFDAPARQSFVYELVEEKADLTNAIALHATMFNAAMVVGPSVGGIIYALVGPAWCFTFNAFSFIFVLTALFLMKLKPFVPPPKKRSALLEIKEGLQYVAHHPTIRVLIAGIGVSSLLAFAYVTLFPAWAKDVLNGNEATNGYLQSARGVGALIGALLIAFMGRRSKRGVWLTIGTFTFSTIMFIYAQSRWLPASLVLLAGIGFGYIIFANLTNSLVQTQVTDELRGRVMGIYVFTFFGLHPIGSLIAGLLAARVGAPTTLMINSVILLLFASIAFIKFPQIRRLE
ncbi:MAG: MFS transporter, partial [Chloroflexi bacterium]